MVTDEDIYDELASAFGWPDDMRNQSVCKKNVDFITITLQRMFLAHWRAFYEQSI